MDSEIIFTTSMSDVFDKQNLCLEESFKEENCTAIDDLTIIISLLINYFDNFNVKLLKELQNPNGKLFFVSKIRA